MIAGPGEHGADHPLLAATIGTLPPVGTAFPERARQDWLAMITMAFNVVYGAEGAMAETEPTARPTLAAVTPKPREPHELSGCDVYVDKDGYVRGPGGRRMMPDEAGNEDIYEYRGPRRDRSNVIWADDSVGAEPGMNFCGPG